LIVVHVMQGVRSMFVNINMNYAVEMIMYACITCEQLDTDVRGCIQIESGNYVSKTDLPLYVHYLHLQRTLLPTLLLNWIV